MSEYISKIEMLIRLKCLAPKADDWNNYDEYNVAASQYDYMCDYLKSIVPADVAPVVHGRWIECNYKYLEHGFIEIDVDAGIYCSNCRQAFRKKKMTYKLYCPNCGAKMDESEGEE